MLLVFSTQLINGGAQGAGLGLMYGRTTSGMEDLIKVQSGLALFPVAM